MLDQLIMDNKNQAELPAPEGFPVFQWVFRKHSVIPSQAVTQSVNDLITSDPTATIFLVRETLAFERFYIAIMNRHSKHLCLVSIDVDRLSN